MYQNFPSSFDNAILVDNNRKQNVTIGYELIFTSGIIPIIITIKI